MAFFLSFLVAMFTSIICIPPLLKLAGRFNLLDHPGERKIHEVPIPRLGGIAIVLATLLPIILWIPFSSQIWYLMLGMAAIVITGLLDDLYDIDYKIKLITQIIAACLVVYGAEISFLAFFITTHLYIDGVVLQVVSIVFIVAVTNALNLSDGLDGLAAGVTLLSLSIISLLAIEAAIPSIVLICVALIGGIFGFLRFNTYPAKIFMGDTGSQFLGFMLAVLSLIVVTKTVIGYSTVLPLLLVGLPLLDTVAVVSIRMFYRKSPFMADRNHFHHRLLNAGYPQYAVVIILYLLQLLFVLCAYVFRLQTDQKVLLLIVGISLICLVIVPVLYKISNTYGNILVKWDHLLGNTSIGSTIRRLENRGLFNAIISIFFLWYIVSSLYIKVPVTADIIYSASVLLVIPLWNIVTRSEQPLSGLERGVAYMMVVLAVYLQYQGQGIAVTRIIEYVLLACLIIVVVLKMLRHNNTFQGSPLDFLILLLAILGPLFVFGDGAQLQISLLVLKAILLFYCVEILFVALRKQFLVVRIVMVSFFALVICTGILS